MSSPPREKGNTPGDRNDLDRAFWLMGSISAFLGVAAGAFGAHALRHRVDAEMLVVFETAARYQMYHALALLATAWAARRRPHRTVQIAGWLFAAGTLVFSGSLYALGLTGNRALGALTPAGGLALLGGWLCLAWGALRSRD